MQPSKALTIGITGHRNLTQAQKSELTPIVKKAIENIIYYYKSITHIEEIHLICTSSLAAGADILFAKIAVENFDCSLKVLLPFEQVEYLKDFNEIEAAEFKALLNNSKVSQVIITGKYEVEEGKPALYLAAGKQMVDENQFVLAIWNEEDAAGIGGTGDIAKYAQLNKKELLVINPKDNPLLIKGNYLPELTSTNIDELKPEKSITNIIDYYYGHYDKKANINQTIYKRIWESCFKLGLVAAFILSLEIGVNFYHNEALKHFLEPFFAPIEARLLLIIYLFIRTERKNKCHQRYLNTRFIAERLRIDTLIYNCGFTAVKPVIKTIYKTLRQFEDTPPLNITNKLIALTRSSISSINDKKYMIYDFCEKQIDYHAGRIKRYTKKSEENKSIQQICLFALLVIICYNIFINLIKPCNEELINIISSFAIALAVLLPAVIARFEGSKYLNEWERLIKLSEIMQDFFSEIKQKLEEVNDDNSLSKILEEMHENMCMENQDWELFMINKNEISLA